MFLDVVGYSALMSRSEQSALDCVKRFETILRAEVPAAGGRLVKFMGDGSLAEFPTAGAALQCAQRILDLIEAQPERPFAIRIGLHLGEVVEEKGDIFGDAVNIAARIQPLADPGGIAMSGTVHAQLKNQGDLRGAYLPPVRLKNIPERLSIFAVPPRGASVAAWKARRHGARAAAVAAALLFVASAWHLLRRHAAPVPASTLTLFYVQPPEFTPEWRKRAQAFDDRMTFRGGAIRGLRWQNRDLILSKKGLGAVEELDQSDPRAKVKACVLLREIGIDYAIYSYLDKGRQKAWKLDFALIDSNKTDIVVNGTLEDDDFDGLADKLVRRLQEWNDSGRPSD